MRLRPLLALRSSFVTKGSLLNHCSSASMSEPGDVKTNGLGGARQQFRTALGNGTLTIKGEKKQETDEKRENYYTSERRCGAFERSFQVPQDVDERKIEASFSRAC